MSAHEEMMNQIYGVQVYPEDHDRPTFLLDGAFPVDVPCATNGKKPQIIVFTNPGTMLRASFSQAHKSWIYIWGIPAHPNVPKSQLTDWCAKIVAEEKYGLFRELLGSFVVIVDEPNRNCMTVVSDILGVRPMFLGKQDGRVIFCSTVWPMYQAGLISGKINYDAVSSWISYGFNCSNGSLFSDLQRLSPGSAVVIKNGQWNEIPYASFESDDSLSIPTTQLAEELHEIVVSTLNVLLTDTPQVTLALSGGYDSRYLLALSLSLSKTAIRCAMVSISREEEEIAHEVAKTLKVPLETIPMPSSEWDLYDNAYHLTADGFPITKFVTYCLAERYANVPMLNGYMGDSLMRGSKDRFQGKLEEEWTCDLVDILQHKHAFINSIIFRAGIAQKIQLRSRMPMEEAVRKGSQIGNAFGWADFYFRQRLYISNNFLQHLGLAESLLPFYSWALLSYKMRHNCRIFSSKVYEQIFAEKFPLLSKIPRADMLPRTTPQRRVATCTKEWARNLLPVLCNKERLTLLNKRWCLPRTLAGMAGIQRYEGIIHHFQRFYLLEEQARMAGLDFDWDKI